MEKTDMIERLKQRMLQVPPLPDEEAFTTSDETLNRYLKAFEWKYDDAEKGLLQTVEYRRQTQPLRGICYWCHKQTGFHSMRQVGHDESGRPVIYANFAQATAKNTTAEDMTAHVTYLIENAKATMGSGVSQWVFIIDCTGMSMSVCRPKVGLKAASVLSSHYPERLGLIICVNHNPIFHAFWKAIKGFLAPGTVSKMRLLRPEAKIKQAFSSYFSDELSSWLWDEITLNKVKPLSDSQREFWAAPDDAGSHDPRGCASYVDAYVRNVNPDCAVFVPGTEKAHCPHPNIVRPPDSDPSSSPDDAPCGGGPHVNMGGEFSRGHLSEHEADDDHLSIPLENCLDGSEDLLDNGSGSEDEGGACHGTAKVRELSKDRGSKETHNKRIPFTNGKLQ